MPVFRSTNYQLINRRHDDETVHPHIKHTSLTLHGSTLFVANHLPARFGRPFSLRDRGRVEGFTDSSAKRMRRYLRSCVANYRTMITLTYPSVFSLDGAVCKEHLRRFLQELKREAERRGYGAGFSAFWFIEFQDRGAPHFHIFSTWAPHDSKLGRMSWLKRTWFRIVGSDDDRHLYAGTREEYLQNGRDGSIAYATKYAQKQEQKIVPEAFQNVGRFWGVMGLRTTMCAHVSFSDDARQNSLIDEAYKQICTHLQEACARGRARMCVRKEGFVMFKILNPATLLRVQLGLNVLSCFMFESSDDDAMLFADAEIDYE